ncbi:aminopeptidase P family protein [Candidatus Bathyarchaeota archaeon]|nr:aminopeptidase P family protein [Candidatus Bathyarchaeota archaeon]
MRKDLDKIMENKGIDALLLFSESYKNPNMYYLTGFLAPDPFIFFKKINLPAIIIVNSMEFSRAQKESIIKDVRSYTDYNYADFIKKTNDPKIGGLKFLATIVKREVSKDKIICVPPDFPSIATDVLRNEGLKIQPMFDVVEEARETKEPEEIEEIVKVQRVNEKVLTEIIELIANCDIGPNKILINNKNGKKPLTVGELKTLIGHKFLDAWCSIEEDIIVACGPSSADPHFHGYSEDKIRAGQPIVFDIYPRSIRGRYWTDMTRTIVRGKSNNVVKKMFEVVLEAKGSCFDALHEGALGSEMYNLCCDIIEKAGFHTTRGGKKIEKGFTHSLGHGVGLEIHENPTIGEFNNKPISAHSVVSIEPGLYDPKVGGVRIEDIVEVTKNGCKNLTNMPVILEI